MILLNWRYVILTHMSVTVVALTYQWDTNDIFPNCENYNGIFPSNLKFYGGPWPTPATFVLAPLVTVRPTGIRRGNPGCTVNSRVPCACSPWFVIEWDLERRCIPSSAKLCNLSHVLQRHSACEIFIWRMIVATVSKWTATQHMLIDSSLIHPRPYCLLTA
jgi:hypothetical protein